MRDVFVAGAFVTPFGKHPSVPLRASAAEAVRGALADAGARPRDVDTVFFANTAEGALNDQHAIRGQVALQDTGLLGAPIANVENACAAGSTAFHLARMAVASGDADVALAVGAEKLTNPDKGKTFAAFSSGWDVERFGRPDATAGHSGFMDVYAAMASDYMRRSGATPEDFAAVSVKSHHNGALNPNAQYREPLTVEQILHSRTISDPLTLLMCAPIGDGAAALIVASGEGLARIGAGPEVRVLATVLGSGTRLEIGGEGGAVADTARAAYERAGVGPDDLDVVEVHDAAAPGELIVYEDLGLAAAGEGPELIRTGATGLGGRVPVNPSGGLLSRGHPVGATGCAQLVELTDQLRGRCGARQVEGARIALAENGGGWIGGEVAAVVVTVLGV
ncbi:MAG: thiolase family protein [Solirubrobacteraceae bacterium]